MPLTSTRIPDQLTFWEQWHRRRGATGNDHVHRELRSIFLAGLPEGKRLHVLDLGCGQGHDLLAFARAGHVAHGLDFSRAAIAQAWAAVPWWMRLRKRVRLVVGDLSQPLPYPDEAFDGVYSHLALHYFDDLTTRAIFQQIRRVVRPGCPFVFSVKSIRDPYYGKGQQLGADIYIRNGHVRHFFSEAYAEQMLDGWKIQYVEAYRGRYASWEQSEFVRAVARRPH